MSKYMIALYIRLSIEDAKTDSMSIPNQRLILREHAMSLPESENAEILEFVDNGHSGTNFERPAVQELLDMVQSGQIDCIIVKDLSRFGRNSIETGYFIERVFPLYHTRFISVSDDFDTGKLNGDTGGIDVAFKYLISECYSRDMSMKTKSAKYAKMRRGEYQSSICPFGYRKGADGRMEPDQEAADVVRMIFGWAAEGLNTADISRKLHQQGIPTPAEYKALHGKRIYDTSRSNGIWSTSAILHVLRDERFIGDYIICKHAVNEIGSSRVHMRDKSEWIRIPDHHPAIVSKEIFERAQSNIGALHISGRKEHQYLLKSKVVCGCCKHAMGRRYKDVEFYCRFSCGHTDLPCYQLHVKENKLEDTVLACMRAYLLPVLGVDISTDAFEIQTVQQAEHEKKLHGLQQSKRQLYERFVLGEIDLDTYKAEKARLDAELLREQNVQAAIASSAKDAQQRRESERRMQALSKELSSAERLTQSLVDLLIEKVFVYPDNRIEIQYKIQDFIGSK